MGTKGIRKRKTRKRRSIRKHSNAFDSLENATLLVWVSKERDAIPPSRKPKERLAHRSLRVRESEKYEVGNVIAEGGMGVVYQARDVHCNRVVALKILKDNEGPRARQRNEFVAEAQITSRLEHPNIVPIHEVGTDTNGQAFYSMKYVRGVTLAQVLENIRRGDRITIDQYPLARLLNVFQKACDAVAFAHANNTLHRDLKPANIMLGDYGEVLVLDWGLACPIHHSPKPASPEPPPALPSAQQDTDDLLDTLRLQEPPADGPTRHAAVLGTPGFLAPELLRRSGSPGEATDVYALGAILYGILTLHSPVRGPDLREVLRKILHGDIPSPVSYNDEPGALPHCPEGKVPPALSDIAQRAMALEPSERHASVRDLQQDIEDYQNGLVWHLVIDENFNDPDMVLSRWEVVGGHAEIKPGELCLHGGEPQMFLLKRDMPTDVRIEFECRQEGSYLNDVGCLVNGIRAERPWDTSISGYAFKYGAYTNTFNVVTRCDRKLWSQAATPLESGRTYHVMVERVGQRLRMFVDHKLVMTVQDPEPLIGSDHSLIGLLGWIADTRYTRVRVYSLGTPWRSDILDYAERHLHKKHYTTAQQIFQDIIDSLPDAERMVRARQGFEIAQSQLRLSDSLPKWRDQLAKAWPGIETRLRLSNQGLTLGIPPGKIEDLEALRGIPLTELECGLNAIRSLEPLRGMRLRSLVCGGNRIEDLGPLQGMSLVTLQTPFNRIRSLEPLRGMPLTLLGCTSNPLEGGIDALQGMKLTWLHCCDNRIRSLEPLRGMPLTQLFCDANAIESLEPLRGMRLTELTCCGNRIDDLAPLAGMPLNDLNCAHNRVLSLAPLRGAPLSTLKCQQNFITTLEPLQGMPLNTLMCGANPLRNLTPFTKEPPRNFWFDCDSIATEELEWLHRAWSRDFRFSSSASEVATLLALRRRDVDALKSLAYEFRGHRYLFIPKYLPWDEAKKLCESLGGHLVTITSREENEFVTSLFAYGASWIWLGIKPSSNPPEWVTGEPFVFHALRERLDLEWPGPKVFQSGEWRYDIVQGSWFCSVIEWDA